jgi:ribosomal protein S27AE
MVLRYMPRHGYSYLTLEHTSLVVLYSVYRNKKLLEALRESPCQHCGKQDGTIVAAHSNQLRDGKGRGIKAHDYRTAALCYWCHMELDQGKDLSKADREELWENAHRKTIGWLFDTDRIRLL